MYIYIIYNYVYITGLVLIHVVSSPGIDQNYDYSVINLKCLLQDQFRFSMAAMEGM